MEQDLSIAEPLAADLAGARVDPNEAQKALAYLRSTKDSKLFFAYLRAINQNGRAVIRSGQTLGYYRDLLAACERHLRSMDADRMAWTLGWAIRLLRYYRAVPDAERPQLAQTRQADTPARRAPAPRPPEAAPQPAAPQLPAVGATFTGQVLEIDERAVLVAVPGIGTDVAVGVIKAEVLGGRQYRVGNTARVEVIGVSPRKGRTILELKPAPKREQ